MDVLGHREPLRRADDAHRKQAAFPADSTSAQTLRGDGKLQTPWIRPISSGSRATSGASSKAGATSPRCISSGASHAGGRVLRATSTWPSCLLALRTLGRLDRITSDVREERFIEHSLQLASQAALDVASHIASEERLGEPQTNRELFAMLGRGGWLPADLVTDHLEDGRLSQRARTWIRQRGSRDRARRGHAPLGRSPALRDLGAFAASVTERGIGSGSGSGSGSDSGSACLTRECGSDAWQRKHHEDCPCLGRGLRIVRCSKCNLGARAVRFEPPALAMVPLFAGEPNDDAGELSPRLAIAPLRMSLVGSTFPLGRSWGDSPCVPREELSSNTVYGFAVERQTFVRLAPNLVLHGFSKLGCPIVRQLHTQALASPNSARNENLAEGRGCCSHVPMNPSSAIVELVQLSVRPRVLDTRGAVRRDVAHWIARARDRAANAKGQVCV